jgi:hypothetical protein
MDRMFLRQNYIPVGRGLGGQNYLPLDREVRVAGEFLASTEPRSSRIDFDVVIPARYEIIAEEGQVTGLLDGIPYDGARFLKTGKHSFVETSAARHLVLLWAQAADRHFTPFDRRHPSGSG